MLREELRLGVHQLGAMGCERFGDLRVQLLPGAAQQTTVSRILNKRVLKGIDRVGRGAALEDQLRTDEPRKSALQSFLRKVGGRPSESVPEFAADRCTHLRTSPH